MTDFTAREKKKVIERELSFRRRVYPKFVTEGRMTQEQAAHQIAVFEAIRADYSSREQAEQPQQKLPL
jgi:hypothetical protein